jgi:DNA-binding protein YbaB
MASNPWGPPTSSAPSTPSVGKSGIDALVERYAGMKEEITAIRASSSSPDRSVTVTAGPGGAVIDIKITDAAMHGSGQALGSSIMSALRLAVADGARQQAAIVQRYVGDRMNIVDRVMATQKEILGDKIAAGEEEEERLRAQKQAETDDGHIMRQVPLGAQQQSWSQPQQPQYPTQQPQHQTPPQPHARPQRQRPQQTSDDDEGFQGIGGSDQW